MTTTILKNTISFPMWYGKFILILDWPKAISITVVLKDTMYHNETT